jgi:hypothetical protein
MENFNINQPVRRPIEELETELAMQNGLVKLNELGEKPAPRPDFSIDHLLPKSTQKGTSTASWDIPMGAVYDRKADGSYTPKFENYKTAYGNEDRLAREQGSLEMIGRGAGRLVSKAGMYALDAVVGTATGIFEALDKNELSGIWDNSFSNWVDDVNKTLDRNLAVYHTDEYNNKNILQQILSSPLVFATSDLADGLAFVGGALLPELAIGILSGGASMPTSFAKLGARAASLTAKKAAKEAGKATAKKAASLTRLNNLTRAGELAGNPLKTAGFLIRSSNFEASVEARHNFHDSIETYMSEFERLNGRAPNKEELTSFTELAKTTANGVWGANMAILSLSNLAMFGKTFGIAPKTFAGVRSVENRILGLTPKRAGEGLLEVIKPTRGQRIFGNAYKILSKPMVEGLYEEGLQGVAGQTMQNYLKSTYDDSMGDYYDVYSALSEGFAHTYGTKEGWKEIGLGMIIGSLGGVMQWKGPAGTFSDSYGRAVKNMNKSVEEANIAFGQSAESIQRRAKAASSANRFKNRIEKGESIDPTLEDSFVALNFVRSQEGLKTHEEIQNEYNTLVDNTEFEVEDEGGTQYDKESMEEYKTKLKEDFSNTLKDYKKAKNTFTRLGLNKEVIKTSTGNMALLQDYLVSGMVMAEKAQRSGKEVGETIEKYLGKDGIYNAMTFFSNLKESQKEKVSELRESKVKLTEYEKDLQKLTKELAGLTEVTDPSKQVELRRNEIAEKRLLISQQILELENSIQENEALLEKETSTDGFGLEKDPLEFSEFESASSNIEKLNQLDSYLTVMRQSGKEVEAEYLENLIEQFKTYTDVKHEMDNTIRRMADNKFLTSNKFKGWLSSTVLGKSYSMSEDFKSALRENNEKIDTQLNKVGIRQGESVEDLMKKYLEKNDKISDREKYRLETIIRLTLTIDSVVGDMNRNLNTDVVQAEKETSSSIPEGDTIRLKRSLGLTEDNVTTIDILDKAINDIVEAVEEVRQRVKGQKESATEQQDTEEATTETTESELQKLEKELEELKKQREEILNQTAPISTTQSTEAKKDDIERRREISNENQLNEIGSNRFLKLNKEGENTELSEVELKLINSLIDKMISQGKSAKEINAELISRGFVQSQATTPAQIETYLQSRIDGKINAKVGESISQEINAKKADKAEIEKRVESTISKVVGSTDLFNFDENQPGKKVRNEFIPDNLGEQIFNAVNKTIKGEVEKVDKEGSNKLFKELAKKMHPDKHLDPLIKLVAEKFFKAASLAKAKGYIRVLQEIEAAFETELSLLEKESTPTTTETQTVDTTEIDNQIEAKEKELESLKQQEEVEQDAPQQTESYRVINTEDFKKMEALQNKLYSEGELTEEEQEELGRLEESVDQWTFATGTIVEGYRLSDLIRLRNQLKSTPIAERGLIEIPDPITKAARGNFKDIENSPNYQNAQQPSHVTAKSSGNNIVLSGLSYEDLAQIAGEDFPTENVEGDYESLRGNTVISMETKRKLDEGGKLIINPPRSTSFNYSIVLQQLEDGTYVPLTSDFASKGFNGPGADFKSVYQVKVGDKVELTVDTKDEKNQELLEAYRNATDEESKAKAIEDLKTSLVIRTNIGGVFNGFLKAKRETGENKTDTDKKFEEMRDSLINNEAFLDRLLDTTIEQDVPMNGGVTVSKVYLGHPNFNFVKGADGMFGVEARPFTKENSKNVKDIGYMLDGKMVTRSGERTEEAIDTTFLGDKGKLEKGVKLPFVVFELNGKKIAYPVDVAELTKPDNTEMRDIFESQEISNEMKVEKLNKLLAGRGVDIKERGRAFTFQNIHDQEFFDNIFGIVDSLSYFYNLKDWVNKDISIQDVLSQQALIDINLAEPFIAPKMSMDFSKMTPIKAGTKVKPAAPKSKGSTGGKKGKVAKDEVNKKCPK